MTALVGPNGTGKSTLLSVLARLMKPKSGKILLYDKPLQSYKETELRKRMGFVFQNPEHQFVAGTVYDELLFGQKVNAETEKKRSTCCIVSVLHIWLIIIRLQSAKGKNGA